MDGIKRNNETNYIYPNKFYKLDGTSIAINETVTLTSDYSYNFYKLGDMLESGSKAYNLLKSNNDYYWLDTKWTQDITNGAAWGFYIFAFEYTRNQPVWSSHGWDVLSGHTYGVRAVVRLKSDVKLVGNSAEGWTIQ